MANSTNHDQEDILDGIQAVEVAIEAQINALKDAWQTLSNRRKAFVDTLAPLPDRDECDTETVRLIEELRVDMNNFDTLVPSLQ